MVVSTFMKAFPEVYLFRNHFKTKGIPLALIGFKDNQLDWATVARRCDFEREQGRVLDPLCRHAEGVAMLFLGRCQRSQTDGGLRNTLGNVRLELSAARQLLTRNPAAYFSGNGSAWLTFIRNQLAGIRSEGVMPASLQPLPELGLLATRVEVAVEENHPAAKSLEAQFLLDLPHKLRSDTNADWSLWAGSATTPRLGR
jgi:hypothetical protein